MRRTWITPQNPPGDVVYFDRLQQLHKLSRRQRRKRLLRIVVLLPLLVGGLLVTVRPLRLALNDTSKRNDSSQKAVSSELNVPEYNAEDSYDAISQGYASVVRRMPRRSVSNRSGTAFALQ